MSAWTWTFIRIDKISNEEARKCVKHAKWLMQNTTYGRYIEKPFDEALEDWLGMHKKHYDYYVNECGVPKEQMTDNYLTKELKKKLKKHKQKLVAYEAFLNGDISFEKMLRDNHLLKEDVDDFYFIKRKNHFFVNIKGEIFRNREYCEEEFCEVEKLIEHLKNPKLVNISDFSEIDGDGFKYGPLTKELEEKIRKFYGEIGDFNFYVHFG
jgi:hypothetical protein